MGKTVMIKTDKEGHIYFRHYQPDTLPTKAKADGYIIDEDDIPTPPKHEVAGKAYRVKLKAGKVGRVNTKDDLVFEIEEVDVSANTRRGARDAEVLEQVKDLTARIDEKLAKLDAMTIKVDTIEKATKKP